MPADETAALGVGHLGSGFGSVWPCRFVPCSAGAQARSVVRRRTYSEPVVLRLIGAVRLHRLVRAAGRLRAFGGAGIAAGAAAARALRRDLLAHRRSDVR